MYSLVTWIPWFVRGLLFSNQFFNNHLVFGKTKKVIKIQFFQDVTIVNSKPGNKKKSRYLCDSNRRNCFPRGRCLLQCHFHPYQNNIFKSKILRNLKIFFISIYEWTRNAFENNYLREYRIAFCSFLERRILPACYTPR